MSKTVRKEFSVETLGSLHVYLILLYNTWSQWWGRWGGGWRSCWKPSAPSLGGFLSASHKGFGTWHLCIDHVQSLYWGFCCLEFWLDGLYQMWWESEKERRCQTEWVQDASKSTDTFQEHGTSIFVCVEAKICVWKDFKEATENDWRKGRGMLPKLFSADIKTCWPWIDRLSDSEGEFLTLTVTLSSGWEGGSVRWGLAHFSNGCPQGRPKAL